MLIPIKKLFEYDEFEITSDMLSITIIWHDYMNKKTFIEKVENIMDELEELPVEIIFNGINVKLSYLLFGGIKEDGIELY